MPKPPHKPNKPGKPTEPPPVEPPPVEPVEPPPTHPVEPPIEPGPEPHPPEPEIEPPTEIVEPPEVIEPPPSEGVPVFDPAVHLMIVRDDFSRYESVQKMGEYGAYPEPRTCPYPAPIFMSNTVVNENETQLLVEPDGSKAIRMLYTGQAQQGPDFKVIGGAQTDNLCTHYFRYLARVTYPGSLGNRTIAIKWFMGWHKPATIRFQNNTHGGWPSPWPLPTRTHWQLYDGSETSEAQAMQPVGPYLDEIVNKGLVEFVHEYRPHTAAGSRDGFNRMYVRGTKIIDVSAGMVNVTPPGGTKPWCTEADLAMIEVANGIGPINDKQVEWGGVHTDQPVDPWTYDVKDFTWWVKEPI